MGNNADNGSRSVAFELTLKRNFVRFLILSCHAKEGKENK
jgi:hypothetical protein